MLYERADSVHGRIHRKYIIEEDGGGLPSGVSEVLDACLPMERVLISTTIVAIMPLAFFDS